MYLVFPQSILEDTHVRFQACFQIIVQRQPLTDIGQRHMVTTLRRFFPAAGIRQIDV